MAPATSNETINLEDIIDTKNDIKRMLGYTSAFLWCNPGRLKDVYGKLRNASVNRPFKIYLKKDIPDEFHIKNSDRIGDILLLAEPGWTFVRKGGGPDHLQGSFERGEHGYNNKRRIMCSDFMAAGPDFKSGFHTKTINIVDIYVLMCHLLNIPTLKHDGHFSRVEMFLKT